MKYIIYKGSNKRKHFVLFDDYQIHLNMAETLGIEKKDIISAGFSAIKDMTCIGGSSSLGIGGSEEDSKIIMD